MVTCHVIYAQNIHQKLISTAQILTNNLQNTFGQIKHSNIEYWIDKILFANKNIQTLDIFVSLIQIATIKSCYLLKWLQITPENN